MRILTLPAIFPSRANPTGGIFILRRLQALRELGHEIAVVRIVPFAPPIGHRWQAYCAIPTREAIDGFPVRTIRALIPPRMIGQEYLALQVQRALQREVAAFRPDVIHASFIIPSGHVGIRLGVPCVVTAHGGDAYAWPHKRPGLMRAAREAVRGAVRVTAVSGYIADCVRKIAERDVDVIWNGGDERFFFPRERLVSRVSFGFDPRRLVIAFAGNLLRAKGLYDLVEALSKVSEMEPLLVLAGDGPEASALKQRARALRVDVRLLGRLEAARVGELFGAADVVTLPSHAEGLPNVLCEAMLCGRAVLATGVGGIPEIVHDGSTGILVPAHDPHALARGLQEMLGNAALRARLGRAARDFAQENLTWRVSARKYDAVFQRALEMSA